MKRKVAYLPIFIVFLFSLIGFQEATIAETDWTEKKQGKVAVKAIKEASRKNWSRAIKYGEQLLEGSRALYGPEDIKTINHLVNLNRYYDRAGRLDDVSERVKRAYLLSKEHFKPNHKTAAISRLLYYKLLVAKKDYLAAILVVWENMAILTKGEEDEFRRLHYLQQLHGLYGLTGQLDKRERILLEQLELNKRLVGKDLESNIKIIMNLARAYCLQQKTEQLKLLMETYGLRLKC